MFKFDYDAPSTEEERALISGFLDSVVDFCGDLGICSPGLAVNTAFWFNDRIEELTQSGFKVFGTRERREMEASGSTSSLGVAIVTVIRATNPSIIDTDEVRRFVGQEERD